MAEPFAYIAHKDNHWAGVCSPDVGRGELKEFLGSFAADGFSISTVKDRAECEKFLLSMKLWRDHPEYKTR